MCVCVCVCVRACVRVCVCVSDFPRPPPPQVVPRLPPVTPRTIPTAATTAKKSTTPRRDNRTKRRPTLAWRHRQGFPPSRAKTWSPTRPFAPANRQRCRIGAVVLSEGAGLAGRPSTSCACVACRSPPRIKTSMISSLHWCRASSTWTLTTTGGRPAKQTFTLPLTRMLWPPCRRTTHTWVGDGRGRGRGLVWVGEGGAGV